MKRFQTPCLFWTVTTNAAGVFVSMRVTKTTMDRVYGGVEGEGSHRKYDMIFGRFETKDEAGRRAVELNFVRVQYLQKKREHLDALEALKKNLGDLTVAYWNAITKLGKAFPQVASTPMDKRFSDD